MTASSYAFCEARLAQADRDRHLSVLYAPAEKRPHLAALYAFNAEIAEITARMREPLPGEIRLQWWRDVLTGGSYSGEGAPIADALLETIQTCNLPVSAFEIYLDARIGDLYADPFQDRVELEAYCGETVSAVIQLAALILDAEAAKRSADAAGHGGCAMGIAGLIRLLPLYRARGKCAIPLTLLQSAGLDAERFLAGEDKAAISAAVEMMISLAREHLASFQEAAKVVSASLRPALLPVALTDAYLNKADPANPFQAERNLSELRRQWILMRRAARGW